MKKHFYYITFLLSFGIFPSHLFAQIDHWETVVFEDDTWDYLVPTSTINPNWTNVGFNTAAWSTGMGGFGYGDGDDNVVIPNGTISLYQRIEFTITDTLAIDFAALTIDYDDSFVAYLNGVEITRDLVSGNPPAWNQLSDGLHEALMYQGNYPAQYSVNKSFLNSNLNQGLNVLAVEVHNQSNTSSDMSSRVFFHLGINNTSTDYSPVPNWFTPPFIFSESNLPIVVINTVNNVSIVDEPKVDAEMGIIFNGDGNMNYMTDPFNEFYGQIGIEIRGSSSQSFPKKGYGLETRAPDSSNYNVSIFDWPADNDWVLYAPYSDKSLIRNVLTYKLGNDLGRYAPRTKLCEVILNGEYIGVYVFTEKIKQNQGRVNVQELAYDDVNGNEITGGYVFKVDKLTAGGIVAWTSPFQEAPPSTANTRYQLHDPDISEINPLQLNYLETYVTDFEAALNGANFSDPVLGYEPFINVGSFVDFMIMNEISKNVDGYRISTFYHKQHINDGGLMVAGPLWDFNLAWGNANYCQGDLITGWEIDFNSVCGGGNPFHWTRLVQDPDFTRRLNCRWQSLRQNELHEDTIMAYIDSLYNYLGDAADRNFTKWQTLGTYVWPNNYIGNTYLDEINYLKTWASARLAWMDANMFGSCPDLSLENQNRVDFSLFPNPTNGTVNLIFNQTITNGKIELFNMIGDQVLSNEITNSNNKELTLENLPQGIYIIKVYNVGQLVGQEKIIKQ